MQCKVCGMGYVPEIPDDSREHRKYHDAVVNGLRVCPLKNDVTIWSQGDVRITVAKQLSPLAQRRRVEKVARLANRETHYNFGLYCAGEPANELDTHAFVLYKGKRAVGLLLADKRDRVWKAYWADWGIGKKPEEVTGSSPIWSIGFVWVIKHLRRQELATTIVNEAVTYLGCSCETVGWYTPFTELGEHLVRSCCPDMFYIAK